MKRLCPNQRCTTPELIYVRDTVDDVTGKPVELWYCWHCCEEHTIDPDDEDTQELPRVNINGAKP